jgi:2-oxoglutarate dehydrogenase E2 component (dihydrolipoamide succinyltransferase)
MQTTNITVPETIKSGIEPAVGRWFKRSGDPVTVDESLVEILTDNVTHEIHAPVTDVLFRILVKDGESVGPGAVLGSVAEYRARPS